MKRICLVGHGQPARNPRLVRDADCLSNLGYDVTVITPRILKAWVNYDEEIISKASWKYIYLDFIDSPFNKLYWQYIRVRNRVSRAISYNFTSEYIVASAVAYLNQELFIEASKVKADLYIAHQQQALPAAAWAAKKNNSKFAADIHDLLSDCPSEPTHLFRILEEYYLKECVYISTMSSVAAQRLMEANNLSSQPIVRYNTQRIEDRYGISHPDRRESRETIEIYWFGQTIGYHSRADQVLKSIPLLCKPVKLILRGNPNLEFVNYLENLAKELNISDCLKIEPTASPKYMVNLAAKHDILLGSQPENDFFHQMAIGNKVFTGMMAGLALALTDTIAHRQFINDHPNCGFLFPDQDEFVLAESLNRIIASDSLLMEMKMNSWDLASSFFNCEEECKLYGSLVSTLIA